MIKIPFFNNKQKTWVGPLGILAFIFCYMLPNHFQIFDPVHLYLFGFEKSLHLIDWTIWIYISDYLYIGLAFFLLKEKDNMNRIYYAQMMFLLCTMIFFFILPTSYPRPEIEYKGISGAMLKLVFSADTPNNACPSLHVAMTFLAGFGFIKEQKKLFPLFMIWAILISISTLTVKQHYLWDVLSGFLLALLFYGLSYKIIKRSN